MSCGETNKGNIFFAIKMEIINRVLAGETQTDLAKEFHLSSPTLIGTWLRKYRAVGDEGLQPKLKGRPGTDPAAARTPVSELERVQRENERLQAENAYLKNRGT